MKEKTGKNASAKKVVLGVLIALILCGSAYAAIAVYMQRDMGTIDETFSGNRLQNPEESFDQVEDVVTKSEEATHDPFEIDKTGQDSSISVGAAGDESIAGVTDPNGSGAKQLTLLTKGVRFMQIVYPAGDNDALVAAQALNSKIAEKTGYLLEVVPDSVQEATYEVLVGGTNRQQSASALNYMAQEGGVFAVQCTGEKVALVGTNVTALNWAADHLMTQATLAKGEACVEKNTAYAWNSDNVYQSAILNSSALAVKTQKVYSINEADANGVPQGGCSDGTYFYQMLITNQVTSDEGQNECKIVKVDLKTGEVIKVSGVLPLNHANDVTYNEKLNCLVVCHNAPNRDTLSYVDVDTLELKETFQIEYEIYCIDYNAQKDQYVVGLSGGQTFRILDSNFKAVGKVNMPVDATKDHVTQGVGSDDNFIYFALYMSRSQGYSVITVFDWDGNYISTLTLSDNAATSVQGREVEAVSVVDGVIYLSCASTNWKYSEIYQVTALEAN